MNDVIKLCNSYNINPENDNIVANAMGIGDLLYGFVAYKNNLITSNLNINVKYFSNTSPYYINPLNALEFRLQLIQKLIKDNNLPSNMCRFILSNNVNYKEPSEFYNRIKNFKLEFNTDEINIDSKITSFIQNNKYIIFHTKCRHLHDTDYNAIKTMVSQFANIFKTKYKIIIIGEKNPLNTEETKWHNITTVYNELLPLSINNDILDLTSDNFNILDFNQYQKDVKLIQNAECNISFGLGGSLCSSIIFGNKTYFYTCPLLMKYITFSNENLINSQIFLYYNLAQFIERLHTDLS